MEGAEQNMNEVEAVTVSLNNLIMPSSEPAEAPDHARHRQPRPETPSTQPQQNTDPEHSKLLFADSKAAGKDKTCMFDPLDYVDVEKRQRGLDTFLNNNAPSKVKRSDGVGKILVNSMRFKNEGLGDVDKIIQEFKKLSREEVNWPTIKKLALTHG